MNWLQKISQSKVDFQNAFIEEQNKNKVLENELVAASDTIKKQQITIESIAKKEEETSPNEITNYKINYLI